MILACFSRQFHGCKKHINSYKGFSFGSISKFLLLALTFLTLMFSLELTSGFLLLVAISLSFVYSKFPHQNSSDSIPGFSKLQVLRYVHHATKHGKTVKIKILEMLFAGCLYFQKEGMHYFQFGTKKYAVLFNPDVVETILSSSAILQKGFPYEMAKQALKGLIISAGSAWHSRRKLLTPSFHFRILKEFVPVFNKQARSLVKRIENLMEKQGSFDIVPLSRLCTLDIILETAMGIKKNGEEEYVNEYVEALEKWNECFIRRLTFPFLWPDFIFFRTKTGKTCRKSLDIMDNYIRRVIILRLRERSERPEHVSFASANDDIDRKTKRQLAFLDLLLDLYLQGNNTLSLQDIEAEVGTFIIAGHETTSAAISFTLYLLGLHRDVQRSVQEEVDMVLGDDVDREITTDDIRKFKYLSCVIKESLRLYPPVPIITRWTHEDTFIKGYKLSKGTTIIIPIYMVHRNPEIFSDPEKFNPERFNRDNLNHRNPFAYVPFSAGPRNCIGQRFAANELFITVATVLRHFDISSVHYRDKISLVAHPIITAENGLHLKFSKRQFLRSYSDQE